MSTQKTFADFDIRPDILAALTEAGFTHPFPIQELTLPIALGGADIIGQAKTGTGKTLGFGIPLLNKIVSPGEEGWAELRSPGKPQALVVVPTRELAQQVAGDLETASAHRTTRIVQVYGGRAYEPQVNALIAGAEVVVGTPGRLIDLMRQGHLDLTRIRVVVLDEADKMLDLGFLPDVEILLSEVPATRHTMLFSATMPGAVVAMARRYMSQPTHIRAQSGDDTSKTLAAISQHIYRAHHLDKPELVARILQAEGRGLTIIFTHPKRSASRIAEDLTERGFAVAELHGDLGQSARERALRAFRRGKVDVLVATEVAARGLDIDDVTHVINYECPDDAKAYVHRIGRTGRAGREGTAVTLVDWDDVPRWSLIDKFLEIGYPSPPEIYSSSPEVYTDLGIPEGVTGTLPKEDRVRAGLSAEKLVDLGDTGKAAGRQKKGKQKSREGERKAKRDGDPKTTSQKRKRRRTRSGKPIDPQASGPAAADN
jgi:superfamily II DNA/RNA helicase